MEMFVQENMSKPGLTFHKKLKINIDTVPLRLAEISDWMVESGVRSETIINVQIVLAEALNNIMEHGFKGKNAGSVEIHINLAGNSIQVCLTDDGMAFIPPEAVKSPLGDKDDLANLPEGGFGWFLIRQITTSYDLHRVAGRNHLRLVF